MKYFEIKMVHEAVLEQQFHYKKSRSKNNNDILVSRITIQVHPNILSQKLNVDNHGCIYHTFKYLDARQRLALLYRVYILLILHTKCRLPREIIIAVFSRESQLTLGVSSFSNGKKIINIQTTKLPTLWQHLYRANEFKIKRTYLNGFRSKCCWCGGFFVNFTVLFQRKLGTWSMAAILFFEFFKFYLSAEYIEFIFI